MSNNTSHVYSGISQRNQLSLQKRRSLETVAEDAFGTNRSRADYS